MWLEANIIAVNYHKCRRFSMIAEVLTRMVQQCKREADLGKCRQCDGHHLLLS